MTLDQKFDTVCFYCIASWGLSNYIEAKLRTICLYLIWSFLRKRRGMELVFFHFLHFRRKIFVLLSFIPDRILLPGYLHFGRYCNMCMVIVCWRDRDVINFETDLIFLIKPFFYLTKKSRQEIKSLEKEKSLKKTSSFHHF